MSEVRTLREEVARLKLLIIERDAMLDDAQDEIARLRAAAKESVPLEMRPL